MSKPVITEYHGVKYSLRPHGLKSRAIVFKRSVLVGVAAFIVALGSALLAASPAQGSPGDCFIEVSAIPPGASPSYSPAPNSTLCLALPAPSTVTTTVTQIVTASALPAQTITETVTATATVMKTVVVTETETQTVTETVEAKPAQSATTTLKPNATPSRTPGPTPSLAADEGENSLLPWGLGVTVFLGTGLVAVGFVGVIRRRRYQGSHVADEEYESYKYDPDDTTVIPVVSTDTKMIPKVELDDDHQADR
jgi:hypothetical protein